MQIYHLNVKEPFEELKRYESLAPLYHTITITDTYNRGMEFHKKNFLRSADEVSIEVLEPRDGKNVYRFTLYYPALKYDIPTSVLEKFLKNNQKYAVTYSSTRNCLLFIDLDSYL